MNRGPYKADPEKNTGLEAGKWYFYFMQTVFGPYDTEGQASMYYESVVDVVSNAQNSCPNGNCEG
jgi:hypothetical protein